MQFRLTTRGKMIVTACIVLILFTLIGLFPKSYPQKALQPSSPPSVSCIPPEDAFLNKEYQDTPILTVYFEPNEFGLTEDSCHSLRIFANLVRMYKNFTIRLEGHTAAVNGEQSGSKDLSQKRAAAVKAYLSEQSIDPDKVFLSAMGADRPVGSNKTNEGRILNRRVEVFICFN